MTNKLRKLSFKREVHSVKMLETIKQIKMTVELHVKSFFPLQHAT